MSTLNLIIDGKKVKGSKGETIMEVAAENDISIPSLCHLPGAKPSGGCRICVVQVEGARVLSGACHTPIAEGMVIHTRTSRVLNARRINLELLIAGHTGSCVTDPHASECGLHQLASEVELGPPRFQVRQPRSYPVEASNPYVMRDLGKCIMCRRCISACNDLAGQSIIHVGYRGFNSKIIFGHDEPLDAEICRDCGICIRHCPTGALAPAAGFEPVSENLPVESGSIDRHRGNLLKTLKHAQKEQGYLSENTISDIGKSMNISPSEAFGIASFYSFLATKPKGRNIVRVCGNLPCYLKDSFKVVEWIGKELNISPGQSTADGRFTLEMTNCIGACDHAPAMMVNAEVHTVLTAEKVPEILDMYP